MTGPRLATTTSRGRSYRWQDEQFTSVTTILSGGIPKPALKPWGERLVAETAVRKLDIWQGMSETEAVDWLKRAPFRETDRAAVQGSDVHDWCERYSLGQSLLLRDAPEAHQPYLAGYLSFLAEWKPRYEITEATVFNRRWGYAGTLDWEAWIDCSHLDLDQLPVGWLNPEVDHTAGEILILGDIKTGKGVYAEVGCQLAAYRNGEWVDLGDGQEHPLPGPVAGAMVLHLTPKGYELIPVLAGEEQFRTFLYASQIHQFEKEASKLVLGRPMKAKAYLNPPRPVAPPHIAALVD